MDKTNPSAKWTKLTTGGVRDFVASSSGVRWCVKKRSEISEERRALERSKAIDNSLKKDRKSARKDVKLILFGIGGSGKSTILNQLRIIHGNGFSIEDKEKFKPIVYSNTIQSLVTIVRAMTTLHIDFGEPTRESDAKMVLDVHTRKEDTEPFSADLLSAMKRLWTDNGVQECFARSNEYQLNASTKYFLDDLDRLGAKDFLPTEQDILRTSVKGTVMDEVHFQTENYNRTYVFNWILGEAYFQCKDYNCRLIDVGEQNWERPRLQHCFESVVAVMFCIAMSDYDQWIGEENRLLESLKLFETISNNSLFDYTIIFLFLNKKDVLEEKLKKTPLTVCFPEYTGNQTYKEAAAYILTKFVEKRKTRDSLVYSRETCATDTSCIRAVFDEIAHLVIEHVTISCGFM